MPFTKEKDFLKNRLKKILRYNGYQEKEALLLDEDSETPMTYFETLCPNCIKPLNNIEAMAFIIKTSEISVSDYLEIIHECPRCKAINDINVDVIGLINLDIEVPDYPDFPIGLFEDISDIMDEEVSDNLTIPEYNKILDIINENNTKILNFDVEYTCRIQSCKSKNTISISPFHLISKTNLSGFYKEVFDLGFYSNKTFEDIQKLYPFERSLFFSLNKEKVEKNQQGLQGLQNLL